MPRFFFVKLLMLVILFKLIQDAYFQGINSSDFKTPTKPEGSTEESEHGTLASTNGKQRTPDNGTCFRDNKCRKLGNKPQTENNPFCNTQGEVNESIINGNIFSKLCLPVSIIFNVNGIFLDIANLIVFSQLESNAFNVSLVVIAMSDLLYLFYIMLDSGVLKAYYSDIAFLVLLYYNSRGLIILEYASALIMSNTQ